MLNFLSEWIEGIAIAVIIASIFEMILPNGSIKKYIKIILGIYVVFNIISPFVDSEALYSLNISETIDNYTENILNSSSTNQDSVGSDLNEIYITTFEEEIKSAIEEQGYEVASCAVDAVFDAEDEDAGIKKIYIKLKSKKYTESENIISSVETVEEVNINIGNTTNDKSSESDISLEDVEKLTEYLSEYFEVDEGLFNIEY